MLRSRRRRFAGSAPGKPRAFGEDEGRPWRGSRPPRPPAGQKPWRGKPGQGLWPRFVPTRAAERKEETGQGGKRRRNGDGRERTAKTAKRGKAENGGGTGTAASGRGENGGTRQSGKQRRNGRRLRAGRGENGGTRQGGKRRRNGDGRERTAKTARRGQGRKERTHTQKRRTETRRGKHKKTSPFLL